MAFYIPKPDSQDQKIYEKVDAGTWLARCYSIVDLGLIEVNFNKNDDKENKPTLKRFVEFGFEVPDQTFEDPEKGILPKTIFRKFTQSLYEKAHLRLNIESWLSKKLLPGQEWSFDIESLLGKPCLISVIEKDSGWRDIATISAVPEGMPVPELYNRNILFNASMDQEEKELNLALMTENKRKRVLEGHEKLNQLLNKKPESVAIDVKPNKSFEQELDDLPWS